jgi:hypothetical protein
MDDGRNLRHDAIAQLQTVIGTMAAYEKEDYLEAVQVVPHLVLTESDPLRFLRFTNFEKSAAAKGLVTYWKRRREIFGDRAFLPVTITGDGALSSDDIAFIKTGMSVILPNDSEGRSVVCVDTSRRLEHSRELRLRAAFYIAQILSENEVSQTEGVVGITILHDSKFDPLSIQCRAFIMGTVPMKIKVLHCVNCTPNWLRRSFTNLMVGWMTYIFRTYPICVHSTRQKDEIVQTM